MVLDTITHCNCFNILRIKSHFLDGIISIIFMVVIDSIYLRIITFCIFSMPKYQILVCHSCQQFTFNSHCPTCGKPTSNPKPAPYSTADPYAHYRRAAKGEQ